MSSLLISPELYQRIENFAEWKNQKTADFAEDALAIHQGKVIDSDMELMRLHNRVYLTIPDLPVLFKKVTTEPEWEIVSGI